MVLCRRAMRKIISFIACGVTITCVTLGLAFMPKDGSVLLSFALYVVLVIAVIVAAILLYTNVCALLLRNNHRSEILPLVHERTRLMESASNEPYYFGVHFKSRYSGRSFQRMPPPSRPIRRCPRRKTNRADLSAYGTFCVGEAACRCCGSKRIVPVGDDQRPKNLQEGEFLPLKSILSPPKFSTQKMKEPQQQKASFGRDIELQELGRDSPMLLSSGDSVPMSRDAPCGGATGCSNFGAATTPGKSVKFPAADQVKFIKNQDELRNFKQQPEEQTQFATIYELCYECKELPDAN